ncbi:MAG: flagellar protein FlgN [Candidatus Abyssobacteria bacterium SURF_5]|uniref:Flagellar protein FlgN n=1 Tax=Abyssobacteria bacterium (strain SURF_5) TaxID=2093360 RepID=A0A3A4P4V3_ABYX5|nr:MAG: flagellar protein FlgN [Candidatus Abyssubacteria bacterium SURF_5]
MEQIAERLAAILETQIENYHTLKRLALDKRKALSANDLKALPLITVDIQDIAAANYRLEEERKSVAEQLARELGFSKANVTLGQIAERLTGPLSERLHSLRSKAIAAIHDTQRQNRINVELLKYCSNLMDSVLKNLVEPESNRDVYGRTGVKKSAATAAALFDHHI